MGEKVSLIAAGDLFMTRRFPKEGYPGLSELAELIGQHDVRFVNLEMTFHDSEGFPAAESGGTWAMASPRCLDDVLRMNFNLFNTANNHSGDYGTGGVLATARHLRERDMVFAGTGANLGEASRPAYLETRNARVALIACSASLHEAERAGGQSDLLMGRPGLNPLRHKNYYHLDPEHYKMAEELVALSRVNDSTNYSIAMGYTNPFEDGVLPFGNAGTFVRDTENHVVTKPNEEDMTRILGEIAEAKRQADLVFVSYHSHAFRDGDTNVPALFTEEFARACIDAGAQVFIGHGPHKLQGIELYHGGVIFYSVGNFLFETETVELQPYDAYISKKMPTDTRVGAYMDARSNNGTRGYGTDPDIWRAVAAGVIFEDGKPKEVRLYPVDLGMGLPRGQKGVPRLSRDEDTLRHLAALSAPYGTSIRIENGAGFITLPE